MEESLTIGLLREWVGFLQEVGADAAIVFIVVMLTCSMRRILPGPTDDLGRKTWEASYRLERYVMPFVPFIIGTIMAIYFNSGAGPWITKPVLKIGMTTGSWSLAVERIVYKTWFGKTKHDD
jgi:hypothetical protein